MKNAPHTAVDAEICRFKMDGSAVWQPIIIERWDDGKSSFTRPAIFCDSWRNAISAAHDYLQAPTRVL